MDISVRPAAVDDAPRMAEVHIAAWQHAYNGVVPEDYLAGLDLERLTGVWGRDLESPTNGVSSLVGEIDGQIEAIATVGPFRDKATDDDPSGELWMINCHPGALGTGVSTKLHLSALDRLRSDGHHRAALWVVDQNPRARRFYEREGWTEDSARKEQDFGDQTIVEVRYLISL